MSLLEQVLKAREEAEQKPPCQKCKHLFWIDKETPFCKKVDKFILPELPPNKRREKGGRLGRAVYCNLGKRCAKRLRGGSKKIDRLRIQKSI
jgi:hypothetical protein